MRRRLPAVVGKSEQTKAREIARKLTAGMVGVNRALYGVKGMPWVGALNSGISYHMGPMGHKQFCQVRVVSDEV